MHKADRLSDANSCLLHNSWHCHASSRPFIETLLHLLDEGKLSDFDMSFLQNWLHEKDKGRVAHADEQARNLAVLYSNHLGEKMYTTTAPMLGLPSARQARRIRAKESAERFYLPGLNGWAMDIACSREVKPLQNGMDGTRIICIIELYQVKYLVGKEFPSDVRLWPSINDLDQAVDWQQIQDYVLSVRHKKQYAAEAYSFNLSDTTGKLADVLIGSIPQPHSGVTGDHIFAMMLEVEKMASTRCLSLVGHCTDSASNALSALLKLAIPVTYQHAKLMVTFLGLHRPDFHFLAPFLRPQYPSIAYPCWNHSSRMSLRNLMNDNLTIVAEKLPNSGDGMQQYAIASIQDLHKLKQANPSCTIKYADITPYVHQNCDATARVLTSPVIEALCTHVPGSQATQLYLLASTSIHEPYRNSKFGPPPVVVRSL